MTAASRAGPAREPPGVEHLAGGDGPGVCVEKSLRHDGGGLPDRVDLIRGQQGQPLRLGSELADPGRGIGLAAEHGLQVVAALGQGSIQQSSRRMVIRRRRLGQEPAAQHRGRGREDAPEPFRLPRVTVEQRLGRGQAGTDQPGHRRCGIQAGIEERGQCRPGLGGQHGRAAFPEGGGRTRRH